MDDRLLELHYKIENKSLDSQVLVHWGHLGVSQFSCLWVGTPESHNWRWHGSSKGDW
jgi:hypothetical protein